jgi:hypothetical protein
MPQEWATLPLYPDGYAVMQQEACAPPASADLCVVTRGQVQGLWGGGRMYTMVRFLVGVVIC